MRTAMVAWLALALAAAATALCAASSRVNIPIVARPRDEPEFRGPFPIREPEWVGRGPFAKRLWAQDCVKGTRATFSEDEYLLDVCQLRNVTATKQIAAPAANAESSAVSDGSGEAATPPPEPEVPRLLGIFRGWKVDPITLEYKYMVFDDGDECSGGQRFSFVLELMAAKNERTKPRVVALKQSQECQFYGKLLAHVPDEDRVAANGIHTHGVMDISDAQESLPTVCGKMKCQYGELSSQVRHVNSQLRKVQSLVKDATGENSSLFANFTMESAQNTLDLTSFVLEKALELLQSLEDMSKRPDFNHEAEPQVEVAVNEDATTDVLDGSKAEEEDEHDATDEALES